MRNTSTTCRISLIKEKRSKGRNGKLRQLVHEGNTSSTFHVNQQVNRESKRNPENGSPLNLRPEASLKEDSPQRDIPVRIQLFETPAARTKQILRKIELVTCYLFWSWMVTLPCCSLRKASCRVSVWLRGRMCGYSRNRSSGGGGDGGSRMTLDGWRE